ncbi:MAG TPA: MFS transporter [Jatrophihabitans sp.]|nr:MFS transporter [Jatrophihabitans sp.]
MRISPATERNNDSVRPARVLTVACLGYAMIVLDITIVNVAIPAMKASLHANLATMQLVVDAYVIVLASLVLTGATAVGRFGAVRMFRAGITVFGAASVLCGGSPDGAFLIAMRALQGFGAILLVPASLVVLTRAYPEPAARAKAVAVWATVAGSPVAFGPIVGGALVSAVGWRSIFLINVPLVLGALWLSARHMPVDDTDGRAEPQDFLGQIFAACFLGGIALALTEGHQLGWTDPLPVAALVIAVAALTAFVIRQRTFAHPMLPADLLRAPGFGGFIMVGLLLFVGYYGFVFVVSVFLQQVRGYGPVLTGISFLPSALPITFMPLVAGRINARLGALRLLLIALALSVLGAAILMLFGGSGPAGMSAGLFVIGLGFGLATVPQITLVMATAPAHRAALASGMLTAGRQSGTTIGVALLGGLQSGNTIATPSFAALVIYLLMVLAAVTAGRRMVVAGARSAEAQRVPAGR